MAVPGWEVPEHTLRLPPGFTLREDDHLVYVCYGDEAVLAVFSPGVSSAVLQAAIDRLARYARVDTAP